MKTIITGGVFALLCLASSALAHYGMVIPSSSMIMEDDPREIQVRLAFAHPFEMSGMALEKPEKFAIVARGEEHNLTDDLTRASFLDHTAWSVSYTITRPGLHVFYMEPQPYWEPAEDAFIKHYTKTYVAAFGDDAGWDDELGLKTEIVPLSKPFGLYAGNVFQGIVKLDGKPVPYAQVEVEYFNRERTAKAPNAFMVTQTIKADANGVFTYAAPEPGWWGFAALNDADYRLEKDGEQKTVELGAVIWVNFLPWRSE